LAADSTFPPLRIAVTGQSRKARFALESAAVRPGFQPIAAAVSGNSTPPMDPAADAIPGCPFLPLDSLLSRTDIDLVFIADPDDRRIELAEQVLAAGKHAVLESPATFDPEALSCLAGTARQAERHCSVWRPLDCEPDFRQALAVSNSGQAGRIHTIRFTLHEMAASLLPAHDPASPHWRPAMEADERRHGVLVEFGLPRIVQLLELHPAPVTGVTGRLNHTRPAFGENPDPAISQTDTGFIAQFDFDDGTTAVLDIQMASPLRQSTGWILQGQRGACASGRQGYTVTDGELYDTPVEAPAVDPFEMLRQQVADLRDGAPSGHPAPVPDALVREIRATRLLSLIRKSHEQAGTVQCDV